MKRSDSEYDFMEGRFKSSYKEPLSPFFLRKPYAGTSAEPGTNQQQDDDNDEGEDKGE